MSFSCRRFWADLHGIWMLSPGLMSSTDILMDLPTLDVEIAWDTLPIVGTIPSSA